jgi:predicted RND superfamily exporter protein
LALEEVPPEESELHQNLTSLRETIARLLTNLRMANRTESSVKLGEYQRALFNDVRETFEAIRHQDVSGSFEVADLPAPLRDRFVGISGKHLLQVYPKKNAWERSNQEEFINDLRNIQPKVTGTPVQLFEYTTLLKEGYQDAALYSLSAIAILIFVHFRSLSCVILALIPVGVGSLWCLGLMGYFDIPFNPANIMTLPLIIGIGVTNGIHILNRFAEEQTPSILARSTGKAVLISGLTTIAGFGSLMLAEHRGIQSLGYVMSTGVAACMAVAITFLPALLNLLSRHGWVIKKTQRENAQSRLGREEPR